MEDDDQDWCIVMKIMDSVRFNINLERSVRKMEYLKVIFRFGVELRWMVLLLMQVR